MRKVTKLMPIELVLPERYQICLSLNGELSDLSIHEYYSADTPPEIVDDTIKVAQGLIDRGHVKAKIERVSEKEILIEVTGNETEVITSLSGEVDLLRQLISPPPPVLPK